MVAEFCKGEFFYRRVVILKPEGVQIELLSQYFEGLPAPQGTKNRMHKLTEQLVICFCAIISGANGQTGTERWATGKKDFHRRFLKLLKWNSFTKLLPPYTDRSPTGSLLKVFSGMVNSMC